MQSLVQQQPSSPSGPGPGPRKPIPPRLSNSESESETDTDTDLEIMEKQREIVETPIADPNVILVSSAPGSAASEETRRHVRYLRRYNLVLPPKIEVLRHNERAKVRLFLVCGVSSTWQS
jgi:hypothetical protein